MKNKSKNGGSLADGFGERLDGRGQIPPNGAEVLPECQSENTLRRQIVENDGHEQ